jgi:hypothetical protein
MEFDNLATSVAHEAGAEVNILSPVDGKPTDVFITIMGADSKEWRKQKKRHTSKIISAKAQNKLEELDYDAMDVEALVAVTVAWRGIVENGKEFKLTKTNAKKLYENAPAVVSQLLEFVSENANFTHG